MWEIVLNPALWVLTKVEESMAKNHISFFQSLTSYMCCLRNAFTVDKELEALKSLD